MSGEVRFEQGEFKPEPLTRPREASPAKEPSLGDAARTSAARRTAGRLLALVAVVQVLGFVTMQVPEVTGQRWARPVVLQLSPLYPIPLIGQDTALGVAAPNLCGVGALLVLFGALLLRVAVRRAPGRGLAAAGPTALVVFGAALAVLGALTAPGLVNRAGGAALAAVLAVMAVSTTRDAAAGAQTAAPQPGRWLLAGLLTLVPPLGLGRAVFAPTLAPVVRGMVGGPTGVGMNALLSDGTPLLWASGAVLLVGAWATVQLLPPWAGRPLTRAAVLLVAAIVLVAGPLGTAARSTGAESAELLRTIFTSSQMSACTASSTSATPQHALVLWGNDCRHVAVYRGQLVVAEGRLSEGAGFEKALRLAGARGSVEAPVIGFYPESTVLAVSRDGTAPSGLVAFGPGWRFNCPGGSTLRARFRGALATDPSSPASTTSGTPRIDVMCGTKASTLDPDTGQRH